MEMLKPFSELKEPDLRQKLFCPRTIEDNYASAKEICLDPNVPEEIKSHFATALNLVAYSWFYYPFNTTAQLMSYITVEKSLQYIFNNDKATFKELLSRAVKNGLINESGFSHRQVEENPNPYLGVELAVSDDMDYAEALKEILPSLRNQIAHGETTLHPHGYIAVKISAELINQLFSNSAKQRP
ncbi:MAG: hypothetical protein KJ620_04130 [Candidatus Edwardsbacteria bacterium]|nr:hypothetical protein [Candidatus Edwardsbacteria bacterium]MBU1575638.1 hypothetical protein [Candidatus Edwardsbacteria bacterium]MBU2462812.1 hypothetical protein [Candidatus Edwardsbacteria bacterium]MBU2593968.1 hypothetical protein [Candidatus Edwardsbacteria bacterium]